jgi:hypothetical protein
MSPRSRLAVCLVGWLGLSAATGCDRKSEPPPVAVSGTVLLDGKPLDEGFLHFKTVETGGFERFDVKDGEFHGKAQVGTRRVEIFSNQGVLVEIDGKDVEVHLNFIHESFNTASTLTAEVTAEGPNRFKFDVHKK